MTPVSPISALAGGLLIGLAASGFVLLLGRIAGISGLLASATRLSTGTPWALSAVFIIGIPLGAWLAALLRGVPQISVTDSLSFLVAGGLLVGFGTRLGSGCTSGHGVCGIARLSPRSLAATAVFMTAGALTVFVVRHVIGG